MTQKRTPLVNLKNISISFGGIKAVDGVSVDLYPGEVVGLLGHNGAGKSTLIKCLSGAYQADAGEIFINGKKVIIISQAPAIAFGLSAHIAPASRNGAAPARSRSRTMTSHFLRGKLPANLPPTLRSPINPTECISIPPWLYSG